MSGESQGWRSLVGCRLWGRTESDMTEVCGTVGLPPLHLLNTVKLPSFTKSHHVQCLVIELCSHRRDYLFFFFNMKLLEVEKDFSTADLLLYC